MQWEKRNGGPQVEGRVKVVRLLRQKIALAPQVSGDQMELIALLNKLVAIGVGCRKQNGNPVDGNRPVDPR